jgi:hypothetical protein
VGVTLKVLSAALLLCVSTLLQSQTVPPDKPEPQNKQEGFMQILPASYSRDAPPLRPQEKFRLFAVNTINPFQIVASAAQAGFSQAVDTVEGYGQGGEGYGKRFGAFYADKASSEFFGTFLFPSLLRQDPRYFRQETGSGKSRAGYAISRIFVTRNDSGHRAPNISLWMGSLASGGLSNAYYPDQDRGAGLVFSRAGVSLGTTAGFNLFKEFWPDIKRKFFGKGR